MKKSITILCENAINFDSIEEAFDLIEREADIQDATGYRILAKFQLFDKVLNPEHAEYCNKRRLTYDQALDLFFYGESIGIDLFFTPMDSKYVSWCEEIGVKYYKIRYYDRKNIDIISECIDTKKPIFISTDYDYVYLNERITNLFCSPKYPSKMEDYIPIDDFRFKKFSGFSDHLGTIGLLQKAIEMGNQYHELHVRIGSGYLEDAWSVDLKDVEEVLSGV